MINRQQPTAHGMYSATAVGVLWFEEIKNRVETRVKNQG